MVKDASDSEVWLAGLVIGWLAGWLAEKNASLLRPRLLNLVMK